VSVLAWIDGTFFSAADAKTSAFIGSIVVAAIIGAARGWGLHSHAAPTSKGLVLSSAQLTQRLDITPDSFVAMEPHPRRSEAVADP
jgi:hypothetical protein